MKKLAILLAVAALTFAQVGVGPAPLAPGEVVRVVSVKYVNPGLVADNLVKIFPGITRVGSELLVRGQPSVVDMIEEAIKKMDVAPPPGPEARPAPNVEITIHMLYGSAQQEASATVPTELEATVRQLRTVFPYKSYRVMDTEILRGRDGQGVDVSGTLPGGDTVFQIKYTPRVNSGPAPRSVRAERFQFSVRTKVYTDVAKTQFQYSPTGINTELDAREGQKTVVGKSNITNSEDAIILVITPRVIE